MYAMIARTLKALIPVIILCHLSPNIYSKRLITAVSSESIETSAETKLISFAANSIGLLNFLYFIIFIIDSAKRESVKSPSAVVVAP